ncbi:hypothetical protein EDB85DRAFT_326766 [Lactarius pseudohatsudake]|nr:hypothetical protein EDB85DRAFT_326766 [Lactarius pseudohatsudake]
MPLALELYKIPSDSRSSQPDSAPAIWPRSVHTIATGSHLTNITISAVPSSTDGEDATAALTAHSEPPAISVFVVMRDPWHTVQFRLWPERIPKTEVGQFRPDIEWQAEIQAAQAAAAAGGGGAALEEEGEVEERSRRDAPTPTAVAVSVAAATNAVPHPPGGHDVPLPAVRAVLQDRLVQVQRERGAGQPAHPRGHDAAFAGGDAGGRPARDARATRPVGIRGPGTPTVAARAVAGGRGAPRGGRGGARVGRRGAAEAREPGGGCAARAAAACGARAVLAGPERDRVGRLEHEHVWGMRGGAPDDLSVPVCADAYGEAKWTPLSSSGA